MCSDYAQIGRYAMCNRKKWWKVTAIVSMIAGIVCLNYFTFNGMRYEHALYRVFLYLPLVLGTFWFGFKGAFCISTSVLILYFPYVIEQWQGLSLEDFHEVLEAVLYVIIAFVLGFLVEKERKKHRTLVRAKSLAAVGRAVSEIAHDMKTPLMVIGGFANQVSRKLGADVTSREQLRIVTRETARLESMVREMLDFGKPMEIQLTKTDLNQLVRETVEVAQPMARKRGIGINIDLEPSFPPLMLDVAGFKRMLLNLITNAVQASPIEKRVVVRTHRESQIAKLEVIDSGPGINQEEGRNIFNPFFSKKDGGTGLGLAIAKKIVEAHRGEISYHSDGAKGATFTVELPVRKGKS